MGSNDDLIRYNDLNASNDHQDKSRPWPKKKKNKSRLSILYETCREGN